MAFVQCNKCDYCGKMLDLGMSGSKYASIVGVDNKQLRFHRVGAVEDLASRLDFCSKGCLVAFFFPEKP